MLISIAIAVLLGISSISVANDDILDFLPAVLGGVNNARSCDDGVFANCTSPIGCRRNDGVFTEGICLAKPEARALAEQLAGRWRGLTSLSNGTFHNYLDIDLRSLASLGGDTAFSLSGTSHSSGSFNDSEPNPIVASYDSGNDDWYILDFWGTDIGEISILELAQTRENQFDGCEFTLNYPDLTYKDGVCNSVRLQRSGTRPSFAANISNIISDFGSFISGLITSAQGTSLDSRVAERRPSIERIRNLMSLETPEREPIVIVSPQENGSTNSAVVEVIGTVEENINLDRVELQGERLFPDSNSFNRSLKEATVRVSPFAVAISIPFFVISTAFWKSLASANAAASVLNKR